MRKISLLSILIFILQACVSTSEFQVTKVGSEPENTKERSIYVLPRTVLEVRLSFEKESRIPGIYRKYTDRLLGIEGYITEPSVSWYLGKAEVTTHREPDPDQYYSINLLKGEFDSRNFLALGQSGFVLDPSGMIRTEVPFEKSSDLTDPPWFTDISVRKNLIEITDTLYKTIIRDSALIRMPIVRKQQVAKTTEQKAEEAANFIFRIRNRRFKLLAGQKEVFPEGQALAITLKELDQLEKEYLELFLGKTIKQEFTRSFLVVPEENSDNQEFVLAKFSPQLGLMEKEAANGQELRLSIIPQHTLELLKTSKIQISSTMKNNLYYRLPELAKVEVSLPGKIFYDGRISIYQAGILLNLPLIK